MNSEQRVQCNKCMMFFEKKYINARGECVICNEHRKKWLNRDYKKAEKELLFKEDIIRSSSSAIATCDLEGNMDLAEEFVKYLAGFVMDQCQEDLELFSVSKALFERRKIAIQWSGDQFALNDRAIREDHLECLYSKTSADNSVFVDLQPINPPLVRGEKSRLVGHCIVELPGELLQMMGLQKHAVKPVDWGSELFLKHVLYVYFQLCPVSTNLAFTSSLSRKIVI